ncbi:MAG: ABC-F family ATP-binding cassette domain-containing protein, partial [Alphaproteobacteria bacterium]
MPPRLLLSVKDAMVRYSEKPVFENLAFNIHENTRIALVGNNGTGKTTLMNIITGAQDLDAGARWQEIGVTTGYLRQEIEPVPGQNVFDYIFSEIKHDEKDLHAYKVDIVAEALHLDLRTQMSRLSGGEMRRAGLARALVEEPDILLLDEPTNHLDLEAIEWLEGYLKNYRGTLLCVSHDRTFLSNITNQVFWLDRGKLKVSPHGFAQFDDWSTMLLKQEERELKNRKQIVALEVEWASRGVKARRKRNQRRLQMVREAREKLRADQSAYNRTVAKISLDKPKTLENTSKIVSEFYNTYKSFHEEGEVPKIILDKFSLRIQHGDRIGVLGKNGSGKTTFLRILIGEVAPDQGSVKRRKELEFSYFDQKRSDLKAGDTLRKALAPAGGDHINVMGKPRHVCGYLKDFLFDPGRIDDRVSSLSGGQKNRLMLAKILADPKSCLILDEPTNDLDMDTLDMLAETLSLYQGTLIIVSHDRDFLDQTVTRILAFEGNGKIERCVGGYSDYLEMGKGESAPLPEKPQLKSVQTEKPPAPEKQNPKLTYKLERELTDLPEKIAE